ncbi:MAG: hypothetical protein ACK55X_01840 [Synechococcaceae cyanobacterium]|jgi:hypothetical protein
MSIKVSDMLEKLRADGWVLVAQQGNGGGQAEQRPRHQHRAEYSEAS